MARDFAIVSTALVLLVVAVVQHVFLPEEAAGFAVIKSHGDQKKPTLPASIAEQLNVQLSAEIPSSATQTPSSVGLIGFGAAFGAALVAVRQLVASNSTSRVACRAEAVEKAAEKEAALSYLQNIPEAIMDKGAVKLLTEDLTDEELANPQEDSVLYSLKVYAETYGEGKQTAMPFWDYLNMRQELDDERDVKRRKAFKARYEALGKMAMQGRIPVTLLLGPVPFDSGLVLKWAPERELFAGDQTRTIVTDSRFGKNFMANTAFYREGLEPWQRGLEIGMAHGYFIIGPFIGLGPLRDTSYATTAGLVAGVVFIGIVSVFGLVFGSTVKPRTFDRPNSSPASGFIEMINWHAVGGFGGAGFAHALLTILG